MGFSLKKAFEAQKAIGFNMMVRGYVVKEWSKLIDDHGTEDPDGKIAKLIKILWEDIVLPMWEQRNEIKHSSQSHYTQAIMQKIDKKHGTMKTRTFWSHQTDSS